MGEGGEEERERRGGGREEEGVEGEEEGVEGEEGEGRGGGGGEGEEEERRRRRGGGGGGGGEEEEGACRRPLCTIVALLYRVTIVERRSPYMHGAGGGVARACTCRLGTVVMM